MTIRDQLNKCKGLDTLTAFVEQKLAEAQAEMVERCDSVFDDIARDIPGDEYEVAIENGTSLSLFTKYASKRVRALSPNPHARERWELEASAVEAKAIRRGHSSLGVKLTTAEVLFVQWLDRRIAELQRQLAALPAVTP